MPGISAIENVTDPLSSESTFNHDLAERYPRSGDNSREAYAQRIESLSVRSMESQASQLSYIEKELDRLGVATADSLDLVPEDFLVFVLGEGRPLFKGLPDSVDPARYKINEDFQISYNENPESGPPDYVMLLRDQLFFSRFLMSRGVDVVHTDLGTLRALLEGPASQAFFNINLSSSFMRSETSRIIREERDTYARDLKDEFAGLTAALCLGVAEEDVYTKMHEVLQFYKHVPSRFDSEIHSFVPEFKELIGSKGDLPSNERALLDDFLESNEGLICEVLGEDYLLDVMFAAVDYETGYRNLFGYSKEDISERRTRNWQEVNRYIIEEVASRGYLTVDDLRQIHVKSTKGVLPFFAQGLRTDRLNINRGWIMTERTKNTVSIGGDVSTTPPEELNGALELLVNKANRLVVSGYPQVMFEVALGNLYAEYAAIHPHPDGNGTNAVFFLEAVKVLHGGYTPPSEYAGNYIDRVKTTLNGNPLAQAVAYVRLQHYSKTHKIPKTLEE